MTVVLVTNIQSLVEDGLYDPDDLLQRYGMLVSSENVNFI